MPVLGCLTVPPLFVYFVTMCDVSHSGQFISYLFGCFLSSNFYSNTGCMVFKGRMIVNHWNNWEGWGRKQLWHGLRYSVLCVWRDLGKL